MLTTTYHVLLLLGVAQIVTLIHLFRMGQGIPFTLRCTIGDMLVIEQCFVGHHVHFVKFSY